jgi:two-component system cell cycle response regulator
MGASILLVGDGRFRLVLLGLIRELATIEVADNPQEAMPLIQAQQPDVVLVQATQPGSLALCQQVKAQKRLAWIYCVLLAESTLDADLHSKSIAQALEMGADAYIPITLEGNFLQSTAQIQQQNRILQAQIQVGIRQVQIHRELTRTNDVLSAIALSDPLTDLNNRRALEWELPRQIQNARNRKIPISLVILDVDFFKTINDTYGHLVGDSALKILAARLRHNLRLYDTPFRYGGEEFVILLSDTDQHDAAMIGNRLCHLMRNQPFRIDNSLDLKVTVSIGVATLQPEDDTKGTSLLERADRRLLRAKAEGRDRVVSEG